MQFPWVVKIKFAKLYTEGQAVMWQLLHDQPYYVVCFKNMATDTSINTEGYDCN